MSDESRGSFDGHEVVVWDGMSLKELSKELSVRPNIVIKKLLDHGIFARPDQTIDIKLAFQLVHDFGLSAIIRPD